MARDDLVGSIAATVSEIIVKATREAKAVGKQRRLPVVQCFTCTATKTCCHSFVVARLYEGVVIAHRLRADARDTPELRDQLRARADAMEAAGPRGWRTPCLFLDGRERCTIYDVRPSPCGTLYVYTPPERCSEPGGDVEAYVAHAENVAATALEEAFREQLSLRKKVGRRFLGALPRMVLLALEAWDRPDFREYLRAHPWPTDEQVAAWGR